MSVQLIGRNLLQMPSLSPVKYIRNFRKETNLPTSLINRHKKNTIFSISFGTNMIFRILNINLFIRQIASTRSMLYKGHLLKVQHHKGRDSALCRLLSTAFPGNTFSGNPVQALNSIIHVENRISNTCRSGPPCLNSFKIHVSQFRSSIVLEC